MALLITVLGSCVVAASSAVAADRPANPAGPAWWSNPPSVASPVSGPKVPEYGVRRGGRLGAQVPRKSHRPAAWDSRPEFAPDPPGLRAPPYSARRLPGRFRDCRGGNTGRKDQGGRVPGAQASGRFPPPSQLAATALRCDFRSGRVRRRASSPQQPLHLKRHKGNLPRRWAWAVTATRMPEARVRR